jgi:hypothetical protein
MVTAANMEGILGRLRQWQRYADNMARLPAEIYRCEEHVIRDLLRELGSRYGGARQWAIERGIGADVADRLKDRLLV